MSDCDAVSAKNLKRAKFKPEQAWSFTVHEECSTVVYNTSTAQCIVYTSQTI